MSTKWLLTLQKYMIVDTEPLSIPRLVCYFPRPVFSSFSPSTCHAMGSLSAQKGTNRSSPSDGEWLSEAGPYLDRIQQLCLSDPSLRRPDGRSAAPEDHPRPGSARAAGLALGPAATLQRHDFLGAEGAARLRAHVARPPPPAHNTLYIPEGLARDVAGVLGAAPGHAPPGAVRLPAPPPRRGAAPPGHAGRGPRGRRARAAGRASTSRTTRCGARPRRRAASAARARAATLAPRCCRAGARRASRCAVSARSGVVRGPPADGTVSALAQFSLL